MVERNDTITREVAAFQLQIQRIKDSPGYPGYTNSDLRDVDCFKLGPNELEIWNNLTALIKKAKLIKNDQDIANIAKEARDFYTFSEDDTVEVGVQKFYAWTNNLFSVLIKLGGLNLQQYREEILQDISILAMIAHIDKSSF